VTEETPLNPQSLYAETKIASERFLLGQSNSPCAPLIFRLATLYGISPRTRFDMILNQFVLEAYTRRELLIYQRAIRAPSCTSRMPCTASCSGCKRPRRLFAGRCTTWARKGQRHQGPDRHPDLEAPAGDGGAL